MTRRMTRRKDGEKYSAGYAREKPYSIPTREQIPEETQREDACQRATTGTRTQKYTVKTTKRGSMLYSAGESVLRAANK